MAEEAEAFIRADQLPHAVSFQIPALSSLSLPPTSVSRTRIAYYSMMASTRNLNGLYLVEKPMMLLDTLLSLAIFGQGFSQVLDV